MTPFYNLKLRDLNHLLMNEMLLSNDLASDVSHKIYKEFYKQQANLKNLTGLISQNVMIFVQKNLDFSLPKIVSINESSDLTVKFLMEFTDGEKVETVLIPFHKSYTICLSSQVGCAMKCSFCYTGTQGLKRNLKAFEIVSQYLVAFDWLKNHRASEIEKTKIVFMGQGEPLHNFSEVKLAIEIFLQTEGLHIGPRQITLSTAGYLPGLKLFYDFPRVNLALSLHSAFDHIRNELIPLARAYPLTELFSILNSIPRLKRQYLTIEYLLIKGLNHDQKDAQALIKLLKDRPVIINLIPFNEFPGSHYKRPGVHEIQEFKEILVNSGQRVMIRTTKGNDILAACGQLKAHPINNDQP